MEKAILQLREGGRHIDTSSYEKKNAKTSGAWTNPGRLLTKSPDYLGENTVGLKNLQAGKADIAPGGEKESSKNPTGGIFLLKRRLKEPMGGPALIEKGKQAKNKGKSQHLSLSPKEENIEYELSERKGQNRVGAVSSHPEFWSQKKVLSPHGEREKCSEAR